MKTIFRTLLILSFIAAIAGGVFLTWGYFYITRDLPRLTRVEDYQPPAVTQVFSRDGTLIAEFAQEHRYPAKIEEVPIMVRNCFLAAEDAAFYSHPGIDLLSIARAFVRNLQSGSARQGGSTITQQVVKNLLLSAEKSLIRKMREAVLSYQIEQRLSKDDILQIYLNQIYFGNGAYGIKAASRIYFKKELDEMTLAEAAMLAGLPQAPSRYSPVSNFSRAKMRQRYVLNQMVRAEFITPEEAAEAEAEEIEVHRIDLRTLYAAPYFGAEVRRIFHERFSDYNIDRDGLRIFTTIDLRAQEYATRALRAGLREIDKRQGWRGPIDYLPEANREHYESLISRLSIDQFEQGEPYPAMVTQVLSNPPTLEVLVGDRTARVAPRSMEWARRRIGSAGGRVERVALPQVLRVGDVIEVSTTQAEQTEGEPLIVEMDQTPELEGSFLLIEPSSGRVVAMVGGYSYQRSQFNRVTQSYRQPGSSFKPVVYLAAVDSYGYTPSSIVHDVPRTFRIGDQLWQPSNFDRTFLGDMTLRVALEKSRNLVSADVISRIGVEAAIIYARKLGIQSRLGRNLSLSLGSSEVTLLELTRAYGVFPNKGVLVPSAFIERIEDRTGSEIFNFEQEQLDQAQQVVSPQTAFLMANMMKGVVERGTGQRVRELGRPAGGKTGTSNEHMDNWFIGFTPEWAAGVWIGFDVKRSIGNRETGGRNAAPIWLNVMKPFLEYQEEYRKKQALAEAEAEARLLGIELQEPEVVATVADFTPPDGLTAIWVHPETGRPIDPTSSPRLYEYFVAGTEPVVGAESKVAESYFELQEY